MEYERGWRGLRVEEMRFRIIDDKLYCEEVYENDESFLILVDCRPVEFIKKVGRLRDDITQEDLDRVFANWNDDTQPHNQKRGEGR